MHGFLIVTAICYEESSDRMSVDRHFKVTEGIFIGRMQDW